MAEPHPASFLESQGRGGSAFERAYDWLASQDRNFRMPGATRCSPVQAKSEATRQDVRVGPCNIPRTLFRSGLERLLDAKNSAEEAARNDVMLRSRVLPEAAS